MPTSTTLRLPRRQETRPPPSTIRAATYRLAVTNQISYVHRYMYIPQSYEQQATGAARR